MLWRRLAATGRVVTKAITMHIMPCAVIILVVEPPLQPHTRAHVCATATTMHIVLVEALCLSACGASVVHAVHVYVWSMYDVRVALNAYACAHRFFFFCVVRRLMHVFAFALKVKLNFVWFLFYVKCVSVCGQQR